jgi:hypothetical protein
LTFWLVNLMQLLRVFHDRLISEDDKSLFKGKVEELVQAR